MIKAFSISQHHGHITEILSISTRLTAVHPDLIPTAAQDKLKPINTVIW